ncbi:MAG: 4a-hydroxytetrahydrobiopterin dehydratase [Gemmatimonadota bacterium]
MATLNEQEIRTRLDDAPGWTRDGDAIRKTYTLDSFPEAIAFVNRIAEVSQRADHHPDIDIRFDRVACSLSTHNEGGLTDRDFDLARRIDVVR